LDKTTKHRRRWTTQTTAAATRALGWRDLLQYAAWVISIPLVLGTAVAQLDAWNRHAAIRNLTNEAAPTAISYSMLVQSEIEKQSLVPYILANDPDVLAALKIPPGGTPASLQAARAALDVKLAYLCSGTTAGVIYVLDATGLSVAASNYNEPGSFVGTNYAFRPYFTGARARGDAEYFATGIISHLPGLFVAHRILDNGKFIGVVVVKIQFQSLEAAWAQLGDDVFVTDSHKITILTDVDAWRYHSLGPLPLAVQQSLLRSGQYGTAPLTPLPFDPQPGRPFATPAGAHFVAITARVPARGWTLYLAEPIDPALRSAGQAAEIYGLILTMFAIGIAVLVRMQIQQYFTAKARNEENQRLAITDSVTQLPNRRAFEAALARQWRQGVQTQSSLAVVMIDVDHFKLFNDRYGHPAGDECLRVVAAILRETTESPTELAARYGGEEFILLLPNTGLSRALAVAESVRAAIRNRQLPHETSPLGGVVTVSLGLAVCIPSSELSPEGLIAAADAALYMAKNNGRDQVAAMP